MAWFKSKGAVDAPTPVTPERLEAALSRQEITADRADDGAPRFYCFINGFPVVFDASFDFSVVVSAATFERLSESREEEVLGWVKSANADTHFVTTVQNRDENGVFVAADGAIFTSQGLTDEQLDDQLELMLVGVLSTMSRFYEEFDITPEDPGNDN
ncbi:YbjN domain-containing protein [Corynebacterium sp. CCM 9204]|uniref:YbjN domain-containing protein n=1 Tax=Corynebacterium sp. CCM 9204 TaxID=3057616 RepID=UPI0035236C7C